MSRRDGILMSATVSLVVTMSLISLLGQDDTQRPQTEHRHFRQSADVQSDERTSWSRTFGRVLRDGVGPKCNPTARYLNRNKVEELPHRDGLGRMLTKMGLSGDGVELGVKQGEFAAKMLASWTNGGRYTLVDPWMKQEDYTDLANVDNAEQQKYMNEALDRTKQFSSRVAVLRNFSYNAVKHFEDCSLDFVYVDAVHDYDGVRKPCEWRWIATLAPLRLHPCASPPPPRAVSRGYDRLVAEAGLRRRTRWPRLSQPRVPARHDRSHCVRIQGCCRPLCSGR